jgi:LPXTG-motif cell wall-anchored protein
MSLRALRPLSVAASALLVGGGLALLPAVSASAVPVADFVALQAAFSGSGEVELAADISAPADTLTTPIATGITLDLAGHDLHILTLQLAGDSAFTIEDSVGGGSLVADATSIADNSPYADARAGINVPPGATLTIESGSITAKGGGQGAAGIGAQNHGGSGATLGSIVINGGTVIATSELAAAGIGQAAVANGGSILITGGDVTATAGQAAAGIGGGFLSDVSSLSITGGTVRATGASGAGIGGGYFTNLLAGIGLPAVSITGGTITATSDSGAGIGLGSSAIVGSGSVSITGATVTASSGAAAIGSGSSSQDVPVTIGAGADVTTTSLWALGNSSGTSPVQIDGTLRLASGSLLVAGGSGNIVVGSAGIVTGEGTLTGPGSAVNNGAITLENVVADVTVNNYLVTFDGTDEEVRVYASTFAAGEREFPADPTGSLPFQGWFTEEDGAGEEFTETSVLTGDATVYPYFAAAPAPAPAPEPQKLAATGAETPWAAIGTGAGILLLGAILLLRRRRTA